MEDMLDTRSLVQNLDELASQIQPSDPEAARRLRELRMSISNDPHAENFLFLNVNEFIDPERILRRYKAQRGNSSLGFLLALLRNILILTFLIYIVYGVLQVINSYNSFKAQHIHQSIQPFLTLWQNGFDGNLSGWYSLSSIAINTFVLISIILLLTIIISVYSKLKKYHKEWTTEQLRENLANTLTRASLYYANLQRQRNIRNIIPHGPIQGFVYGENNSITMNFRNSENSSIPDT